MKWDHDKLAADLASSKLNERRLIWTDMQLGPAGSPRPDVYTIDKSYSSPMPTAYEIKVSRSDFLADVTNGKYLKYFDYASYVYFAVPDGLIKRTEVPEGCGLIVRKEKVWRALKRAPAHKVMLPEHAALKLLIDGVNRLHGSSEPRPRTANAWTLARSKRMELGKTVAEVIQDLDGAKAMVEHYQREREAIVEENRRLRQEQRAIEREAIEKADAEIASKSREVDAAISDLCEIVGCDRGIASLRYEIRRRAREIDRDTEVRRLQGLLRGVQSHLAELEKGPVQAAICGSEST